MDKVLHEALILEEGGTLFAPEEECEPFCIREAPETTKEESPVIGVTAH